MHDRKTVAVALVLLVPSHVRANESAIIDSMKLFRLGELAWMEVLSPKDSRLVTNGLDSPNDRVVESALFVVALHGMKQAEPKIRSGVGQAGTTAHLLGTEVAKALRSDNAMAYLNQRLSQIPPVDEELGIESTPPRPGHEVTTLRESIRRIVVIDEVRRVRKGAAPSPVIRSLVRGELEERLLEGASLAPNVVIDAITQKLKSADVASMKKYELMSILYSYPVHAYASQVIDVLAGTTDVSTEYGTVLLLWSLRFRVQGMSESERTRLTAVLPQVKGRYSNQSVIGLVHSLQTEVRELEKTP